MGKILGKNLQQDTIKRISLRLPKKMIFEINSFLQQNVFSLKHRSYWICNTIIELANKKPDEIISCILEEWITPCENKTIQVSLNYKTQMAFYKIKEILKSKKNITKISASAIIRTAIIQELLSKHL